MKTDLHITILQLNLHWESVEQNLRMFSKNISAIKGETDLIILPEMFSTGFSMKNETLAEDMSGKTVAWMKKMAAEKNAVVTGSIIAEENARPNDSSVGRGNYFNRLVWMRPDGSFETYDKRHLFRYGNEHEHYTAGNKKIIVELNGWKICPLICYDLRFPVWSRNKFKNGKWDYDLLIYVANWPERRNHPWKTLLLARAIENQSYVAGVNRVGNDGNDVFHSGDSAVINYKGEVISKIKPKEENVETVLLSHAELSEFRKNFPVGMDADEFKLNE